MLFILYITWLWISYALFFFFKKKTAYGMRICDWSSYVCSSDLTVEIATGAIVNRAVTEPLLHVTAEHDRTLFGCKDGGGGHHARRDERRRAEKNLIHSPTPAFAAVFRDRRDILAGLRRSTWGRRVVAIVCTPGAERDHRRE